MHNYQQSFNLYMLFPSESLCNVSFTPVKPVTGQCMHRQAPIGFTSTEVNGRATSAPSLRRNNNSKLTDSKNLYYDVLRVHKTRYLSLWIDTITSAHWSSAGYTVLQMSREQLGPSTIRLYVGEESRLVVSSLQLTKDTHNNNNYDVKWFANVRKSVQTNINVIETSALYQQVCNVTLCATKHWVIFGGSVKWGELYPRISLLTPDPVTMRLKYSDLDGAHPFVMFEKYIILKVGCVCVCCCAKCIQIFFLIGLLFARSGGRHVCLLSFFWHDLNPFCCVAIGRVRSQQRVLGPLLGVVHAFFVIEKL